MWKHLPCWDPPPRVAGRRSEPWHFQRDSWQLRWAPGPGRLPDLPLGQLRPGSGQERQCHQRGTSFQRRQAPGAGLHCGPAGCSSLWGASAGWRVAATWPLWRAPGWGQWQRPGCWWQQSEPTSACGVWAVPGAAPAAGSLARGAGGSGRQQRMDSSPGAWQHCKGSASGLAYTHLLWKPSMEYTAAARGLAYPNSGKAKAMQALPHHPQISNFSPFFALHATSSPSAETSLILTDFVILSLFPFPTKQADVKRRTSNMILEPAPQVFPT